VANAATVPVALCSVVFPGQCPAAPAITIYNGSSNTVHIIVDVFGVYDDSTLAGGERFTPAFACRMRESAFRENRHKTPSSRVPWDRPSEY